MRVRSSINVLAIIAVLLHAAVLVRHGGSMLQRALAQSSLELALGVICHGAGGSGAIDPAQIPGAPAPSNDQGDCPICNGCVAAAAILSTPDLDVRTPPRQTARMRVVSAIITKRLTGVRPPPRGPPRIA